ncbi:MAG: response regulator [Spirochaetaceae bacterium]|nr:response regulator [Spirochaetaceae bacterium]
MDSDPLGVVIVDDEPRIGQMVKSLIEWEELNLSLVSVETTGKNALNTIRYQKPAIVITDIRMPQISGLDLISRTMEISPNTKFIVISGHKDFEYARKALEYGVHNYLLKPVNANELNRNLKQISEHMAREQEKNTDERQKLKAFEVGQKLIRRNVFEYLFHSQDAISLEEIRDVFGIELSAGLFNAIDVKLDYRNITEFDVEFDRQMVDLVSSMINTELAGTVVEMVLNEFPGLHIICLLNYTPAQSTAITKAVNRLLSKIELGLMGLDRFRVTIGMGVETGESSGVSACICQARTAVNHRIVMGTEHIITAEMNQKPALLPSNFLDSNYHHDLSNCIDSFSADQLILWVDSAFQQCRVHSEFESSMYYAFADAMIGDFISAIGSIGPDCEETIESTRNLLMHCNSIKQMKGLLNHSLVSILQNVHNEMINRTKKPIRLAEEYVEKHFAERITLESIADHVALSSAYFSDLFKRETGRNFSAYLTDVRLDQSKKKLIETNDTIESVAAAVGYRDVRHFSKLFAKNVGIKPAMFRRLHS